MEGAVDEFLEDDNIEGWKAILSVAVTLIKENEPDISKRILFQKSYRVSQSSAQKHPKALAEAMSTAMSQISETIIRDVYKSVKE